MKKQNKDKIKVLLGKLNSLEQGNFPSAESKSLADEIINKEYFDATNKIKESSTIKFLTEIDKKLTTFQKEFDLKPIAESISSFQDELETLQAEVEKEFGGAKTETEQKLKSLSQEIKKLEGEMGITADKKTSPIMESLTKLQSEFKLNLDSTKERETSVSQIISGLQESIQELNDNVELVLTEADSQIGESVKTSSETLVKNFDLKMEEFRKHVIFLISRGGGSMNRQIFIGGVDPLTKYTDINLKAGSNVTITYLNNNTTKKVDVTISATGGGGGGTVRSIVSVSVPTVADSASGTDYVYLVSGTTTITMPDATAGNTNLYTIKNVGTGTVTINTTSSQTLDGSLTITMPVRYTSVDLISDTANWNVT